MVIAPNTVTKASSVPLQSGNISSPVSSGDKVFVVETSGWVFGEVELNDYEMSDHPNVTFTKVKTSTASHYINNAIVNAEFSSGNYRTIRPRSHVPQNLQSMLNHPLLHPGPNANSNGYLTTNSFDVSNADRINIQPLGDKYGCHHGGSKGGYSWYADHQPPSALIKRGILPKQTQRLYPHSKEKSDAQGVEVARLLKSWGFK